MSKISLRQTRDYFLLLLITGTAIVLSLLVNGNKEKIKIIVLALSFIYFIWGLLHHKQEKTLKKEIVFEYAMISILGAALVIGLL